MAKNHRLEALIAEAGMSNKGLAARMQDCSRADGGNPLKTDHTHIAKYISGATKRPKTRSLDVMRLVFSERLGRPVSVADLGYEENPELPATEVDEDLEYPINPVGSMDALDVLTRLNQTSSSLVVLPQAWSDLLVNAMLGHETPYSPLETGTITEVEVQAAQDAHAMFSTFDYRYGGGQSKMLVAKFLEATVLPCIRFADPETELGRRYFQAAAALTRLAGWTAYDIGEHGLAQRYLYQGFRLARAAGDLPLCGRLLAGMSHQANFLGHYQQAVNLARGAAHIAGGVATPTTMALFHAMEARGLASLGDQNQTIHALGAAEDHLSRGRSDDDPDWIRYFDESELHAEYAHCYRDLGQGRQAMKYATASLSEVDGLYVRSALFVRTVYATAQLHEREVEEAVSVASDVADAVAHLNSHRLVCYVKDFHQRLRSSGADPQTVRSFSDRAYRALGSKGFPAPSAERVLA